MSQHSPSNIHQEKLAAILVNAVDAIITINQHGIVETVNPATETLFGYRADEIIGQNVSMLMPNPDRDQHDQYIKNYLTSGTKKIIGVGREVLGLRKNGSTFPLHLAVSEIKVDGTRLFTGICRDISDQKRLVQSERLAAIGQMMAGLAHESRNAFQKSHACLTNLSFDVREMPESLKLVQKVQQALDHLNSLLDEVRDYSAPIVLERTACDIESMIREIWMQLKEANPTSKAATFEIQRTDDFPEKLKIDRYRIGQVFWNLLENARVACRQEDGAVWVRLRIEPSDQAAGGGVVDGGMAVIEVADNGQGISEENLASIFQPFFTTKTRGTGLGLAICQRIIDAHQGTLTAKNQSSGGAVFCVQLPYSIQPPPST